jgi:hypothetical protein
MTPEIFQASSNRENLHFAVMKKGEKHLKEDLVDYNYQGETRQTMWHCIFFSPLKILLSLLTSSSRKVYLQRITTVNLIILRRKKMQNLG